MKKLLSISTILFLVFSLIIILLFFLAAPFTALAATETYNDSLTNAQNNANNPADWRAANLVTIPSTPPSSGSNPYGLQYVTINSVTNLVVRTATSSYNFKDAWVGDPNYKIFGTPTTKAAWVTTGNEFTNFYSNHGNGATNSDLIKFTERSLGMDSTAIPYYPHNAIVEYAVVPDNNTIMRSTRYPEIATYTPSLYGDRSIFPTPFPATAPGNMTPTTYSNFQTYYGTNFPLTFPLTQLGYTYFWGNGPTPPADLDQINGLSEFVVLGGTSANIYGIYSTVSYIYTMHNGEYGNGYANFNVSGPCDTIWAGHSFQYNVSRVASSPNQIHIIGPGGDVSGGEGILVWSLNYTVTVDSGCTVTSNGTSIKDYVVGTNNIGIFFDGDTSTDWGDPITVGVNKVDNSGTITGGPLGTGIAIQVWNGDTTIVNNAGGYIGDQTAIDCSHSAGAVSITNRGTISGPITLKAASSATFDIGNTSLTVTGGALSSFTVGVNSSTDYGKLTTTGTTANAGTAVTVVPGGYIPNNTSVQVMSASAGSVSAVPGSITSTSPIFTFAGSIGTGDHISVTAARINSYNSFASDSNASRAGSVLNAIAMNNTATGDMVNVLGALDSLTSASAINQALENMLPNVDNSSTQTSQASLDQFLSTIFAHLDGFKNITASSSDAASSDIIVLKDPDVWTSGFGTYLHQDEMASSNGYNATIWGTALGFDIAILKNLRAGLSGGFAQDFIRTKDSSARTDVDSYQGSIYASYAKDAYFVDSAFSFAYNTYDTSRHVAAGSIDRTTAGDYNGQQYSGYIGGGYKFTAKNIELTPLASFQYSHLRLNSYTESGAGALNLKVNTQDYNMAQTGLGMKIGYPLDLKNKLGKLTPEAKFKWLYDWVGDAQQATSTFTGGGGSFGTQSFTPAQSSYDFGAKLTLETVNFITISLSYDLELKEGFYGHYGLANVRYRF